MKKVLSFIVLAVSLFFANPAQAQIKLGVKGGLNVSNLKLDDDMWKADNKAGFFIGPMMKVTVPVTGLSFDVAALYDQKEAKVKVADDVVGGTYNSTTVTQKFIDIPVNVRYGFGLSSLANIFLFAGPQWGINVGNKNFKWNKSSSYSLKKANFSVNVGAGVTLLSHLQASVNYNIECNKSGKMDTGSLDSNGKPLVIKGRNNTWQISLGYWF